LAISDPAADYIENQQAVVIDFVFRLTGDRSRAGVMGKDICNYVLDNLDSGLDLQQIRVRLFARAFELNEEALRGIDRSFLEGYYRSQLTNPRDIARFYPWEVFLAALPLEQSIPFLLTERYGFGRRELAEIVRWDDAVIQERKAGAYRSLVQQKRLDKADLKELPYYGFLPVPDGHQSSLSLIMRQMDTRRLPQSQWIFIILVLLGILVGALFYAFGG
jgi:hypothetical protein